MRIQKLFMLCVVAVAGAGCGETAGGPDIAEVGLETQDETDGWPRPGIVFYGNEGFRQMMSKTYVNEPNTNVESNFTKGAVKSFVVYPSCKVDFYAHDDFSKDYDKGDSPYYVREASSSHDWSKALVNCDADSVSEDANLLGETVDNNAQDQLPLFRQDDLSISDHYNFNDKTESVVAEYGSYVVVYRDGTRHSTALFTTQMSWLGLDSGLTKTEVRNYSAGIGVEGCNTPRTCFSNTTCDTSHEDGVDMSRDPSTGDLERCAGHTFSGQSYCTGQGYCVRASDGAPVVYSHGEPH